MYVCFFEYIYLINTYQLHVNDTSVWNGGGNSDQTDGL